jgi:hypothetical protein
MGKATIVQAKGLWEDFGNCAMLRALGEKGGRLRQTQVLLRKVQDLLRKKKQRSRATAPIRAAQLRFVDGNKSADAEPLRCNERN